MLLFCWLGVLLPVSDALAGALNFYGQKLSLHEHLRIYPAPGDLSPDTLSTRDQSLYDPSYTWSSVESYIASTKPIKKLPPENPDHWLVIKNVVNHTAQKHLVMVIHGSIVDEIQAHVFADGQLESFQAGGYNSYRTELSYALDLKLAPNRSYNILISVKSRYLTGPLKIEIQDPESFYARDRAERNIVYLCLGALIVLGLYNLVLFIGVREWSYLFYSLYLFAGTVGWAAVFNVLVTYFDIYSLGWNLIPFYLAPVFNSLFLLSFLRISAASHPLLFYLVSVLALFNVLMVLIFGFIDSYLTYYSLIIYNSSLWLFLSLWAGIQRLREGYRPARFFVLGFSVIAVGSLLSILPGLGIQSPVDNFYLATLVAQTIDMTLLALALADKIALMRSEKQAALKQSHDKDVRMLAVEKASNLALQESNDKLQQAISIYEDTDRQRKNFLILVNHELRTPVNALVDSVESLGELQSEPMDRIRYGAENLSLLLDELSVFSELSNKHNEPVYSRIRLSRLMEKLVGVAQRLASGKHLHLEWQDQGQADVLLDAFLLEAAIKPVLDNACKFTEKGRVRIAAEYLNEQSKLVIQVEDDGPGFDDKSIHRLLAAFEQSSEGFQREVGGLGLGLYITSMAVKILGGDLGVGKARELKGARVCLELPCERLEPCALSPKPMANVLVVEDNLVNAKVLMAILAKLGIESDLALNGQQALDAMAKAPFDLVFMDLQMPVMDGFEAVARIKQQAIETPVVAVTANSEQDARRKCFALGMADVLVKPVRSQDIETLITDMGGILPSPSS